LPGRLIHAWFLGKNRADLPDLARWFGDTLSVQFARHDIGITREGSTMRLTIEIVAAALLVICISVTSAAFAAAGKTSRSADGLTCAFSVPKSTSAGARCAAIRRQCGGKFYANYCGDKLLSAM
jgi:hypothetical protein